MRHLPAQLSFPGRNEVQRHSGDEGEVAKYWRMPNTEKEGGDKYRKYAARGVQQQISYPHGPEEQREGDWLQHDGSDIPICQVRYLVSSQFVDDFCNKSE